MRRSTMVCLCLVMAGGMLASGCASSCNSNATKLSQLRRGMTYDQTAQVMGCNGYQVSKATVASGEFATMEWNGPASPLFTATQLDFQDGRLLSFTTGRRYGL
jgi:hypothetical protein